MGIVDLTGLKPRKNEIKLKHNNENSSITTRTKKWKKEKGRE